MKQVRKLTGEIHPELYDIDMNNNVNSKETRALGWYALRWTHINDWFKSKQNQKITEIATGSSSEKSKSESKSQGDSGTKSESKSENKSAEASPKEAKKLKKIVKESGGILTKAKTVFPFTPFTDLITIDRHKLTIVYRQFWGIQQTVSVPLENIKNIQADLGPFFGSVTVTSDHFINNTQTIHYLFRKDAERIQKLVQGAMVAVSEEIDISKVQSDELRKLLIRLGEGHSEKADS